MEKILENDSFSDVSVWAVVSASHNDFDAFVGFMANKLGSNYWKKIAFPDHSDGYRNGIAMTIFGIWTKDYGTKD